jgi:hypothetical protein
MYTGAGDIDSVSWNCGMTCVPGVDKTCGVELVFQSLYQITIITAIVSPIAMIEPITVPAIAPIGKALLFSIGEGGGGVGAVELGPCPG